MLLESMSIRHRLPLEICPRVAAVQVLKLKQVSLVER